MDVTYLRYQDDVVIFCQTKRQLNRCKRRMMAVLKERRLSLSRKKTRIGRIDRGFHFLGIHYPGTQTPDNINVTQASGESVTQVIREHYLASLGEGETMPTTDHQIPEPDRIVPHPRTLRKAREQVKQMVNNGVSHQRIRSYLHRWSTWWVRTSETWDYQDLLVWFLEVCRDPVPAAYAAGLYYHDVKKSRTEAFQDQHPVFEWGSLAAA